MSGGVSAARGDLGAARHHTGCVDGADFAVGVDLGACVDWVRR
jgi:hypothetical protein